MDIEIWAKHRSLGHKLDHYKNVYGIVITSIFLQKEVLKYMLLNTFLFAL